MSVGTFSGTIPNNEISDELRSPASSVAEEFPGTPNPYEKALLELFEKAPRGSLLDAPCGKGQLSVWLREIGYDTHCFDIDAHLFRGDGFPFEAGDLNENLPYADNSFDYILCKNGAQRIFALDHLFSEFNRALKPGGTLVVSTPNYARIQRRLRYLVFGSVSRNVNSQLCGGSVDSHTARFRCALLYPQIEQTLQRQGFAVERITSDGKPYAAIHLLPYIFPIRLLSWFASEGKQEGYSLRGGNSAHALAGGRHLIVLAKKITSSPSARGSRSAIRIV